MPFNIDLIGRYAQINGLVENSKITSVYNCLTRNSKGRCGFEQDRVIDEAVNNIDEFLRYSQVAQQYGFKVIYLINSLRTVSDKEFNRIEKRLRKLIIRLIENGIIDIRVASPLIIDYLINSFPIVKVHCSTSMEYKSIREYDNLLSLYNNIIDIVPSWDMNRNFPFLKSFATRHPQVNIEMMANEGCIHGCPFRYYHSVADVRLQGNNSRFAVFFKEGCKHIFSHDFWYNICMSNIIYPWQIPEYNKIGIYHFKLVGRNSPFLSDGRYVDTYLHYLQGIDNIDSLMDLEFSEFNNFIYLSDYLSHIKVRDVIDLLPDIKHFSKAPFVCFVSCGSECNYCEQLSRKLNEKYPMGGN